MNQIQKVRPFSKNLQSFTSLTNTVPFEKARLRVPVEAISWPANRERASVNSFGIGGANVHVNVQRAYSTRLLTNPDRSRLGEFILRGTYRYLHNHYIT